MLLNGIYLKYSFVVCTFHETMEFHVEVVPDTQSDSNASAAS